MSLIHFLTYLLYFSLQIGAEVIFAMAEFTYAALSDCCE